MKGGAVVDAGLGQPQELPHLHRRAIWKELAEPDLERGARDVVRRHAGEIRDVPLDERGVVVDIDTPGDYRREVGS